MPMNELVELNKQITELQAKEFARPTSSPWGAPVLFVEKKYDSTDVCGLPFVERGHHQEQVPSALNRGSVRPNEGSQCFLQDRFDNGISSAEDLRVRYPQDSILYPIWTL
jgi:hypothetical protein